MTLLPGDNSIWGLNLESQNISEIVAQATLLADTFQGSRKELMQNVTLQRVEIGNEVCCMPDMVFD